MSEPRSSFSERHRRSDSSTSSRRAHGASTPFPTPHSSKFEYPSSANKMSMSPPTLPSLRERKEFASTLQNALHNIRSPFASPSKPRIPPSILARKSSVPSSQASSLLLSRNVSSDSTRRPDLVEFRRRNEDQQRVGLKPLKNNASATTFSSGS